MPRRIRPENQQRHDRVKPLALFTSEEIAHVKDMLQSHKTLSTGKWATPLIAVVTTIGVLVAAYGVLNTSFLTVLYERTLKKQDVLESHVENIKAEKSGLEEEKKKLEEEISILIEKKEFLDKENISLSEGHIELERRSKEILLRSFFSLVSSRIEFLRINPTIPIFAKGDNENSFAIVIRCGIANKFTNDCWSSTVKNIQDAVNKRVSGKKIEIRHGNPYNIENVILYSMKGIFGLDNISKVLNQELQTKLNDYIKNNQDIFKTPLTFMFTGLDMKLTDANKERKRLISAFYKIPHEAIYVGEKEFESMPHAEVFKLFQYLGYNPP